MYAAVATLQMAARQLQLSGAADRSKYSRIMSQLREVTDELTALERRAGKQKADPVNITEMLRTAAAMAAPAPDRDRKRIAIQAAEDVIVEGPAHDLRDLICSMLEYAFTVGCDAVDLRVDTTRKCNELRDMCSIEMVIQSTDVPDFLRGKLWNTVRIRRGEVSIVSEAQRCRIGFTLPVERRLAATNG